VLKELALWFQYDECLFPASGCHKLSQLQRLELAISPVRVDVSAPEDWHKLGAHVLQLKQLTSLTWSMDQPEVLAYNTVDSLIEGTKLQQLCVLHVTGADVSSAETRRQLQGHSQVLRRLTALDSVVMHTRIQPFYRMHTASNINPYAHGIRWVLCRGLRSWRVSSAQLSPALTPWPPFKRRTTIRPRLHPLTGPQRAEAHLRASVLL
jgi:hypothetical protein